MGKKMTCARIGLTVFGFLVFVTCGVFNFLANVPSGVTDGNTTFNAVPGVFESDAEGQSEKYPNPITPAAWAFIVIWPLIFLWNGAGALYQLVTLCMGREKSPVLRGPPLIPIPSLILWSLTWGALIGWVFSHDRQFFGLSMFCIIFGALCGYACLGFSYKSYYRDLFILEQDDAKMLWLVRILFHNGFAVLCSWLTCAWKLELVKVVAYRYGSEFDIVPARLRTESFTADDAGTVALAVLLFEIILWFVLENFVWERYCRYTLTIYPVFVYALTAIFVDNLYDGNGSPMFTRLKIISLTGLILASVLFIVRLILVAVRHRGKHRYT